ncbi:MULTISPECIES: response regulator transcription factor [Rhodococcus]|uniref:response regulator transcription factor n=1 Tax=Rhodococcus TaxID=1827 RepID=UPI0005CB7978|nr:response regulator transcription factor [Rhodococcus aetherivorans]MBC2592625.1 response regulator transcription factor [Rhodococcus aetherivorans]
MVAHPGVPCAHPGVVRVLVVDDHPIVHLGVERLVEGAAGMRMCPGARTATAGVAVAAAERPDVVLLDLHLPDMVLPDAAAALRGACPGVKLVLFTGDSNRTVGQIAGLVGMDAVVHKDNACGVLITAIGEVAAGRRYCDPVISPGDPLALSRREYQVLERLAMGESNTEIAQQLGLAPNTVKSYVQSLLAHLDARNRLDAVVKAQQAGML